MPLPPGPGGPGIYQLARWILRPAEFFESARRRHGLAFTARFPRLGTFVFLGDPAAIRDVFHGDPAVLRTGEANAFAAETVGRGSVLVLDGEEHARERRALAPPLHGEALLAHEPRLREAAHEEIGRWRPGVPVALEDACREIALQALLRAVFGLGPGPEREALAGPIRRMVRRLSHPLSFAAPLIPAWMKAGTERELAADRAELRAAFDRVLAGPGAFAEALRRAHPGDPERGKDHLQTMVLAGHDTTAIALAWALGEILPRPGLVAELRAERGPKLESAIQESLRLRPLVDYSVRRLAAPFTAGGVEYPAGITLAPCTLLAHRNPAAFEAPEEFRPGRFLEKRPDPNAWIPFGGGTRRCLGMSFALLELRVVIEAVLDRVEFEPRRAPPPRVARRGLFLAPSDRATFTPRRIS